MQTFYDLTRELSKLTWQDIIATWSKITDYWPLKLFWGLLVWIAAHFFALKLHIIFAFAFLEGLDCFSRWLALSHQHILEHHPDQIPTVYDCLAGIKAARKAGLIQSDKMRKAFYSKMITYLLLIIVATLGDLAIHAAGSPEILLTIVVTYLAVTELLSVLENLDEAGVSIAHALLVLVKSKLSGFLGGGDNHDQK